MVSLIAATTGLGFETFLNNFISVLQGPVALFVAMICVLGGAFMFAQGREGHEGLKNLGLIGIAIGVLAAMPKIFAAFGGGTSGIHI